MNVRDVRDSVRLGRVLKAPHYHAGRRGISYLQILSALERCHHVEEDSRTGPMGARLHPNGWSAFSNLPNRRQLRIDFDVSRDEAGNLLLIVTAYDV